VPSSTSLTSSNLRAAFQTAITFNVRVTANSNPT
jgi:hypothetical protein